MDTYITIALPIHYEVVSEYEFEKILESIGGGGEIIVHARTDFAREAIEAEVFRQWPTLEYGNYDLDSNADLWGIGLPDEESINQLAELLIAQFSNHYFQLKVPLGDSQLDNHEWDYDTILALAIYLRNPEIIREWQQKWETVHGHGLPDSYNTIMWKLEFVESIQHFKSLEELNQALIAKRERDPSNG